MNQSSEKGCCSKCSKSFYDSADSGCFNANCPCHTPQETNKVNTELRLAEMLIESELKRLGRGRISYPSAEQIQACKDETIARIKQETGLDLEDVKKD